MPRIRRTVLISVAVAVLMVWGLTDCAARGAKNKHQAKWSAASAEQINVEISSVEAYNEDQECWITIATYQTPLPINFLAHTADGTPLLLTDTMVPAGHYTQLRLMLTSAELVMDGTTYTVDLNNVRQTGVKCVGEFTAADGDSVGLILDSQCDKWFVNCPKGSSNFKLRPVISMTPVIAAVSSAVVGTVEVLDVLGNPIPVPAGSVVDVYQQGLMMLASSVVNGTVIEADGTFQILGLEDGTYDLLVVLGSGLIHSLTGIEISGQHTDLGTITVKLPF